MHIGVIFYIIILNLEVFFIIKLIPGPQTIPLSPLSFRALSQSLSSPLCSLLFSQVTQQRTRPSSPQGALARVGGKMRLAVRQ